MIAEEHFVAAEDWVIGLLVGAVGVIPDAACAGYYEDAHCLDECVRPEGAEDEGVEAFERGVLEAGNAGEDAATGTGVSGCGDQVDHGDQTGGPEAEGDGSLDDGDEHDEAGVGYELSGGLADGHCKSDSAEAADEEDKEHSGDAEADVPVDGVLGGCGIGDGWDGEGAHVARGGSEVARVIEEDEACECEDDDDSEYGEPDDEAGEAAEGIHEHEGEDDRKPECR